MNMNEIEKEALKRAAQTTRLSPEKLGNTLQNELIKYKANKINQQKKDAIKYIEGQLKYGYIDLGTHDEYELKIVEEAINLWKAVDEFNSIGCTSFQLTEDELKEILEGQDNA